MSDLSSSEKRKLERLFGMGSGYVLGDKFSNRTFQEFADEHTGRNIYEQQYIRDSSGSKANCLRGFWIVENNFLVAKLIAALIDYGEEMEAFKSDDPLVAECRRIVTRLSQDSPVPELDALAAAGNQRDFEALAQQVREAIAKNQPETALDRLHTFVIKFVRTLCEKHGISVAQDKPLHSLFGEYVKELRRGGHLESEMTDRILKSSISVLEAFNDVRNKQSLAHDNPILNYNESLLVFNHVANSVRFLRSLEARIDAKPKAGASATDDLDDDIPF